MNFANLFKSSLIVSCLSSLLIGGFCYSGSVQASQNNEATEHHEEKEQSDHDEGHIELSNEQIKRAGILLSHASEGTIRETLPVYGVVAANAERQQFVKARFPGVIQKIKKSIGDPVRSRETLAIVEANESLKSYPITAAIDGVITHRSANLGEQTSEAPLFILQDFSSVWVELALFPKEIAQVRQGQMVRIKNSESSYVGTGRIIYIAPLGGSKNQSINARVLLDNSTANWHPGHFVNAEITLAEHTAPVVVSSEAIQIVENKPVVFVQNADGFEPRVVNLGRTDGEVIEVLEGILAGETYVSKNSFIIKSEMGKEDAEHGH